MTVVTLHETGKNPERLSLDQLRAEKIAVFESLRTYRGILFRPEEHLDRLFASARTAGLVLPSSRGELRKLLEKAAAQDGGGELFLRLTVTGDRAFVIITRRVWPDEIYRKGICLRTVAAKRSLSHAVPPETKTSCYGPEVLASLEIGPECFESLFLSQEGLVRETRNSNIFAVKRGVCVTPPSDGILAGVTRNFVMEFSRGAGAEIREDSLTRHELFNADEVFLTNTSGEIIPVREIDSRRIGVKIPGTQTRRFMRMFREKVREEISRGRERRGGQCDER
ncbi:MAG TPA: aminotransferase class IV [Candidatus Omnitrophota bacterium]|nr:aminotransferase class IV [Candidatus Omnitrophota bacterium]